MLDNLQNVFEYGESKVRVIIKNGEPWFVARDICDILKHTNSRVAVDRLDEDEKGVSKVYTPGGLQEMTVVSESGLYALVLTSNLPEAKRFKKWVTSEVLPRIRKTGAYIAQPQSIEDLIIMQAQAMKQLRGQVEEVSAATKTLTHRVENLDLIDIKGTPRQRLNAMIRKYAHQNKILFKQGWRDFVSAYNTAYNTNLNLRKTLREAATAKEMTMPEFLEMVGEVEDAIRVADKMLNPKQSPNKGVSAL